jgi:hypothetical protein
VLSVPPVKTCDSNVIFISDHAGGAAVPEFSYIARTMTGQDVKGLISADSRSDVMAMLTQRSLFPMTVAPAKQPLFKVQIQPPRQGRICWPQR